MAQLDVVVATDDPGFELQPLNTENENLPEDHTDTFLQSQSSILAVAMGQPIPIPIPWVVMHALLIWSGILFALAAARVAPAETPGNNDNSHSLLYTRNSEKFLLRVLPLGASITEGWKSKDGNGYRAWFRQQLRCAGWEVEMVGSQRNGTMYNNANEGHVGYRIDQITKLVEKTIPEQPNLILINVGTDDALQKHKVDTAGLRMDTLLTKLYDEVPGTTIILSTLLPNTLEPKLVEQISREIRMIVSIRREKKDRLVLADMSTFIKKDELVDGIHPTASGYEKMASVWWAAFQEAEKENMLQKASSTGSSGTFSEFVEKKLDGNDSISNPHLPAYTAPAQPSLSGSSRGIQSLDLWALIAQFVTFHITLTLLLG